MARSLQTSRRTKRTAARADAASYSRPNLLQLVAGYAGREIGLAAERVRGQLPADLQVSDEELTRHFVWVARACLVDVSSEEQNGATLTLRRRLVELLRADIVRHWEEEPVAGPDMLETLAKLERAQNACRPGLEQTFAAELADRGGLDLVVEVAHDMRSPLTSILFLSEILHGGQSGALNDVQKRQLGIIYSAALGLVGMASDMIEMARGGNQLPGPDPSSFSVNDILTSVHDLVRPTAEEKRLELTIEPLRSPRRIGFPTPLSRVLLNLTTNAIKFTEDGTVELSARPIGGASVEFAVRDTGPGIHPDAMATLYQPFRRQSARPTGYYFSGTGLGLAICRRLLEAMGSELKLETRAGWGTRFSFVLELPAANLL
ncbi:MAG TPA: HAMP domain-containing sensor histidine kinase [Longimicrobiales bacterium]|nr:HAMP domain-containing sensor histidine kinase [Longimicrobiales bacterium]